MADLATFVGRIGTPIVFGEASSTTILGSFTTTNTLSLDALASGSARMSAEKDLGTDLPEFLLVQGSVETGTAPTAGGSVEFYIAWSMDGTNYPAGITGSDGAWPSDGNEDEWRVQLDEPVTTLLATNDGTVIQIQNSVLIPVKGRYFSVVCDNNLSTAFRDEPTASNNASGLVVWPVNRVAVG